MCKILYTAEKQKEEKDMRVGWHIINYAAPSHSMRCLNAQVEIGRDWVKERQGFSGKNDKRLLYNFPVKDSRKITSYLCIMF